MARTASMGSPSRVVAQVPGFPPPQPHGLDLVSVPGQRKKCTSFCPACSIGFIILTWDAGCVRFHWNLGRSPTSVACHLGDSAGFLQEVLVSRGLMVAVSVTPHPRLPRSPEYCG